jgi:hypothetical protein
MEFRLHYSGLLNTNSDKKHTHSIRKYFHHQLKVLASEKPLMGLLSVHKPKKIINEIPFIPLLSEKMKPKVSLDILLIRYQIESHLLTKNSDVDNQLKVIFDALSCPQSINQADQKWFNEENKEDIYCLLENDKFVTSVRAETDRLLWSKELETTDNVKIANEWRNKSLVIIKVGFKVQEPSFDDIGGLS